MQHPQGQYGTKSMTAKKLLIQVTGTYGRQYARPFQAQVNAGIINEVSEQMINTKGSITGALFSFGAGAQMIQPSATPERDIVIPNGWDTRRLRFILVLERIDHMDMVQIINVSGFTDHADLSMSNYIDPNTRFYINSVNVSVPQRTRTPYGMLESMRTKSSNQLVVNRDFQGALTPGQVTGYSIAPDCVFANMQASDYTKGLHGDSMLDTRAMLTGTPKLMQRQHNSAPQYCASIMDTWHSVNNASEYSHANDKVMDECVHMLQAPLAQSDAFLAFLMKRKEQEFGYMSGFDGSFTYSDLIALDPNVDYVKSLAPDMGNLAYAGQGADWGSSDGLTLAAAALAQAVPSYMAQFGLGVFGFKASNDTINGGIVVIPFAVRGHAAQNDQSKEVEALIYRLSTEVLMGVTHGNNVSFSLTMNVDLYGETWIELAMNGGSPYLYIAPTFADALAVPTVTVDQSRLNSICHDLGAVFNNVWDHRAGPQAGGLFSSSTGPKI
jgi:hypothetical protein